MSDTARRRTAAELRREFDEAFARPIVLDDAAREQLLLVRAGDVELALRPGEVAGLQRCPPLTPLPGGHAGLCGLAGVRGALVAVYGLASVLGLRRAAPRPEWIVLCHADRSAALGFDELLGYATVSRADILDAASVGPEVPNTGAWARIDGIDRAVPSVPALLGLIRNAVKGA